MTRIKHYLHGCEETAYEQANKAGLDRSGYEAIVNAIYEVGVDIELDVEAKKGTIVAVDGRPVLSESAAKAAKSVEDWLTQAEAEEQGYTVNHHCYPWVAYKGPTFAPTERRCVLTDLEARLLGRL